MVKCGVVEWVKYRWCGHVKRMKNEGYAMRVRMTAIMSLHVKNICNNIITRLPLTILWFLLDLYALFALLAWPSLPPVPIPVEKQ